MNLTTCRDMQNLEPGRTFLKEKLKSNLRLYELVEQPIQFSKCVLNVHCIGSDREKCKE